MVELGKEYSKINFNSVNEIVSTTLLKMQLGLNELVLLYQKLAKRLKSNTEIINRFVNENFLKCVLDLNESFYKNNNQSYYIGYWLLDSETNLTNLKANSNEENQLIAYSNMMRNIFSTYYATNFTSKNYYIYFESTELFISFPIINDIRNGFISEITNFTKNPVWCTDENGEVYKIYKTKCRGFYNKIKKSKSDVFDINYKDNENRTIFVSDFYIQTGSELEIVFTICIEFTDPISDKLAYICSDVGEDEINYNLDNINSKLSGYFFISSIGFANLFYFPESSKEALTITEIIYSFNKTYFLEEKTYFANNIQRLMSSNYIKYIRNSNYSGYNEIFINGKNADDQIFYIMGEKFYFSIYPIVLENFNGIKEHILNIVYIYNNKLFYDELKLKTNLPIKIILELIIIALFGFGMLYLIVLSFNTLAKYIVIPIKNVNYMLKGINIGGKNRLEFLNFLKKRQDENIEMLEKMNLDEYEKNKKDDEKTSNNLKEENNENNRMNEENKNKKTELIDNPQLINNNENNEQDITSSLYYFYN